MTRSALLQLTIIVLLVCAAVAGLLWWYVQQADVRLQQLSVTRDAKQAELANLSQMTQAQEKLDGLTLDERETTQLALLRHLELENVPINFQVISREARPSGDTTLITRAISLQMVNGYSEHMALLDQLFGNGKIQINKVTMMRAQKPEVSDPVDMVVEGMIYSLEKTLVPHTDGLAAPIAAEPMAPAAPVAPAAVEPNSMPMDDVTSTVELSETAPNAADDAEVDVPSGPLSPDDVDLNEGPAAPKGMQTTPATDEVR
jgi:hypothetical protein